MNKELFKGINETPVRSWSWLNINDISIPNYEMPKHKEYNYNFLPSIDEDKLVVERISPTNSTVSLLPRGEYKGISEQLLLQCEKENNAGVIIQTQRGYKSQKPLVIDYRLDEAQDFLIDNNLIIVSEDSEINIMIKYSSIDGSDGYHNGFTRIIGKQNSKIKIVKLQDFNNKTINLDSNFIKLEEGAQATLVTIDVGGKQTILNWNAELEGDKSEAILKSAYIGDENKIIDMNYMMKHIGKATRSTIDSKGALMDNSSKTFKGTIDFVKGSKGAVGKEEEYSMLLSKGAKARAVPLLLCDEEDVEGSHAASAGKINEEKLFYIMSRGFNEQEAKKIIIEAEINPILGYIEDEVLLKEIKDKLGRRLLHE